jgi:DNA N-6-adenine-methyltransferase (Dam)
MARTKRPDSIEEFQRKQKAGNPTEQALATLGQSQEVTKAGQAAVKIHALETAAKIAARIKDPEAYEEALLQTLENERIFAGEYQAKFPGTSKGRPKGSKNIRDGTVPNKTGHEAANEWCRSFGFDDRAVRRWLVLLVPEDFEIKKNDISAQCCRLAITWSASTVRGTEGTGEFERYTPAQYIEAARQVLGEIDLDPATSEQAQQTVRAAQYFTNQGLEQEWHGRVWLNPPYHRDLAPKFVQKLVDEIEAGRVTAAIMLTNNCTDTDWFDVAHAACAAICFTHGRIKFTQPNGAKVLPTQGQAFFYFGDDVPRFRRAFEHIGFGVAPIFGGKVS